MRRLLLGILLAASLLAGGPSSFAEPEPPEPREAVRKLQPKINEAIDKGVMRLLLLQQRDGSWAHREQQYRGGMTALALYTLLRSGVPADHPAIRRGIERLYAWEPPATYSVACELLALEATQDPRHRPRMERLLERLLSWQKFGWGYPYGHQGEGVWDQKIGRNDLSCTQFAAMGIRAALHAGIEVPPKVFRELVRETRFHQHRPKEASFSNAKGKPAEMAGFGYVGPSAVGGRSKATGSMTCAGIAVLRICRDAIGTKIRPKTARQIDESIAQGLAWLDHEWSVEENPKAKTSHKLYYLYGLERVGSLLGTETIGRHAWYLEGAKELLKIQKDKKDGSFGGEHETCFALLVLVRATGQGTGKPPIASVLGRYAMDDPKSPVRFRAEGHSPLALWITSFGALRAGQPAKVHRVEYLVDGEVVATRFGEGRDPTFRVLHHFRGPGTHQVQARVTVVKRTGGEPVVLESLPLEVHVKVLWPPWGEYQARWAERNLLVGPVSVSASTTNAEHQQPGRTVDHVMDGVWLAAPTDPTPTLSLKLGKKVKANTIVLHPPANREGQRGTFDRPTRIEVLVNGKARYVAVPDPDPLRPTVLRLPEPVRIKRLEIRIPDRSPGSRWHGQTGFTEISLEHDAVQAPTLVRGEDGRATLACGTEDAQIRYTLDGTVPGPGSKRYVEPFTFSPAARLHAIAVLPTGEASRMLVADLRACDGYLHLDRSRWKVLHVDSEQLPGHPVRLALDGDPRTFWHTRHHPEQDTPPHELVVDLGEVLQVEGFTYRTRHDGTNGNVKDWAFYVSDDADEWGPAVGEGTFEDVKRTQRGMCLGPVKGRYVRFVATSSTGGHAVTSCAEFDVLARRP